MRGMSGGLFLPRVFSDGYGISSKFWASCLRLGGLVLRDEMEQQGFFVICPI